MTSELIAGIVLTAVGAYLGVGALVAVAYVLSIKAGPGFRAIIFPGVTALWPLMIRRWPEKEIKMTADLRRAHRRAWLALLFVLPILFLIARW